MKLSLQFPVMLLLAGLALPHGGAAQTFSVKKFSIGGEGGTDYVTAEPGTDTPRAHGIALVPKWNHGFTTNGGDSTVTMFDLKTLAPIKKIRVASGGLDGIMYDEFSDRIILTNHSRPIGTATAIDAGTGEIVGVAELEDDAPEGAASDGKGRIPATVRRESRSTARPIGFYRAVERLRWPSTPRPAGSWLRSRTVME